MKRRRDNHCWLFVTLLCSSLAFRPPCLSAGVRALESTSCLLKRRNSTLSCLPRRGLPRSHLAFASASAFSLPRVAAAGLGVGDGTVVSRKGRKVHVVGLPPLQALRDTEGVPAVSSGGKPAAVSAPGVPEKRVLILMSDTGGGHRASAEALKAAFDVLYPGRLRTDIVDIWTDYGKPPFSHVVRAYRFLGRHPRLWKASYEYGRFPPTRKTTELWTNWRCHEGFKRCMEEYSPDLIVSVHPLCHYLPLRVLERMGAAEGDGAFFNGRKIPFVTVVTDLGSAHPTWFDKRVERVYVPSEPLQKLALRRGMAPENVRLLGLPTRPAFWGVGINSSGGGSPDGGGTIGGDAGSSDAGSIGATAEDLGSSAVAAGVAADKVAARRRLGLATDVPTALLVGGGDGFGRLRDIAVAVAGQLADDLPKSQVVVVAGNNKKLQVQLQELPWPAADKVSVVIKGFVANMDEWMAAADVLVTKAGPGTIAEACTKGLPLVLSSYLPGQEKGNVALVTEGGFGVYQKRPRRIAATVSEWLRDPARLAAMGGKARREGRPTATLDIAKDIADGVLQLA